MRKRTQAELEFDLAVKGWAFSTPEMLKKALPRYTTLYDALGRHDQERLETLDGIRAIVQR